MHYTDYKYDNISLKVFLNMFFDEYCLVRLSRNTCNGYRVNIDKYIIPYLGDFKIIDLEPSDVMSMYAKMLDFGLSGTTTLYVHNTLSRAFSRGYKLRYISDNVMNYVERPLKSHYRPTVLTMEEVDKLIKAAQNSDVYLPVMLGLMLGLRRGEVLGLKWSDIDFEYKVINICRSGTFYCDEFVLSETKTENSNRSLMLSDTLTEILKLEYCNYLTKKFSFPKAYYNEYSLVVTSSNGSPLKAGFLSTHFKSMLFSSKLPNIRFHDLRHTNATLMLRNHIPAKIVSSMLGHANISVTLDIYSHVLTDMQTPAVDVIEKLLQKNKHPYIL